MLGRSLIVAVSLTIMGGVVGGLLIHVLAGQKYPAIDQVRPNKEVILPSDGLLFKTAEGKLVARLDADENGGVFLVYSQAERPIVSISGSPGGNGLIAVANRLGPALKLFTYESGGSLELVNSKRGKKVIEISAEDNGGSVNINGADGSPLISLETALFRNQPRGTIHIVDSGKSRFLWRAP